MQIKLRVFLQGFSLWLCLVMGAVFPSSAWAYNVQVLASRAGGAYDEVIDSLKAELLRGTELRVQYLNANDTAWKPSESSNLIVAVGVDAANAALQGNDINTPILCVLIPKIAFEALRAGN